MFRAVQRKQSWADLSVIEHTLAYFHVRSRLSSLADDVRDRHGNRVQGLSRHIYRRRSNSTVRRYSDVSLDDEYWSRHSIGRASMSNGNWAMDDDASDRMESNEHSLVRVSFDRSSEDERSLQIHFSLCNHSYHFTRHEKFIGFSSCRMNSGKASFAEDMWHFIVLEGREANGFPIDRRVHFRRDNRRICSGVHRMPREREAWLQVRTMRERAQENPLRSRSITSLEESPWAWTRMTSFSSIHSFIHMRWRKRIRRSQI